ncbi:MAG: molybdopterin molybdotransferase MoeA [Alteraurantiacibacter sp.]
MSGGLPPLLPLDEAQARLLRDVVPLGAEPLPLVQADGRILFADLHAGRTQPAADLSAMDGYAMRADDLAGPWRLVGESAAGHPNTHSLKPGETIRISTGALMPPGGGAVLLQENAARGGDEISVAGKDGPTARHIRRQGFDFASGDLLLTAGTRLNPARIALTLMAGESGVLVRRRPRVAILDSGDELAWDPGTALPHQIPASNGAMLEAMLAPHASRIDRLGPVADRIEALVNAFEAADDCDVIVTSGGASVGDHDLVRPALEQWGATIDFWRIALRPGKPLMVGRKNERYIIGLPGNPVSSHVTAYLFVLPLLRALAGAAQCLPQALPLPLATPLPAVGNRTEFVRARLIDSAAAPIAEQDSSALRALAQADLLIRREIGASPAPAGTMVPTYLLDNGGIA